MRWIVMMMVAVWVGGCLAGCAWSDPGGQVARGLGQEKTYAWSENGNFSVQGKGPQTERFTMAEGNIVMKFDDDGNEVVDWGKSAIQYYLRADPNADVAGGAMAQGFEASTRQAEALGKVFSQAIGAAVQIAGMRMQPEPPATETPASGLSDTVSQLLSQLDQLSKRLEAIEADR